MLVKFIRNRTSTVIVMYSLYLYFLGLSLCNTSKVLVIFEDERSGVILQYGIGFRGLVLFRSIIEKEYQPS
jgi:hypothetical protein